LPIEIIRNQIGNRHGKTLSFSLAQISDAELIHAISRGDEDALAFLFDRYRSILFSIILRIVISREEAEDVLQEVFLQVWNKARDFDESRGKAFTWLATLARSRAIDRLRSLGARERAVDEATRETVDVVSDAEIDSMYAEKRKRVQQALAQLPEEQRRVLLMAYFEGCSQSEIAHRLNTPLGTVKTRMRSGMIRLRESFGDRLKELL
jgi:RNA polymerase sigma-70 factor (ECF subfamily)